MVVTPELPRWWQRELSSVAVHPLHKKLNMVGAPCWVWDDPGGNTAAFLLVGGLKVALSTLLAHVAG